jgi:hypothetical protein
MIYLYPTIYGIEIACAFFLLINRFAPLFLLILLPITINIALFEYFLDPDNLEIFGWVLFVHLLLIIIYRKAYNHLFVAKAQFMKFHLLVNFTDPNPPPAKKKDEETEWRPWGLKK